MQMTTAEDRMRIHATYPIVCRNRPPFIVPQVWLPIVEVALAKLEAIGRSQVECGEAPISVIDIGEKYGTLRIEADSLDAAVEEILLTAEDESERA